MHYACGIILDIPVILYLCEGCVTQKLYSIVCVLQLDKAEVLWNQSNVQCCCNTVSLRLADPGQGLSADWMLGG
jgi:hypothetical protein